MATPSKLVVCWTHFDAICPRANGIVTLAPCTNELICIIKLSPHPPLGLSPFHLIRLCRTRVTDWQPGLLYARFHHWKKLDRLNSSSGIHHTTSHHVTSHHFFSFILLKKYQHVELFLFCCFYCWFIFCKFNLAARIVVWNSNLFSGFQDSACYFANTISCAAIQNAAADIVLTRS